MPTYEDNDKYTREMRDKYLVKFYDTIAYRKRYAFLDGRTRCARQVQKAHHFDTLVNISKNGSLGFEEKIRRMRTNDFLVETLQSTLTGAQGWVYTSVADVLLYAYPHPNGSGLDIYMINMESLQKWFEGNKKRYKSRIGVNSPNQPEFYLIPKKDIEKALEYRRFLVDDTSCEEVEEG